MKKSNRRYLKYLLSICIFSVLFFLSGKTETEAATNYSVKFNNILGTSTSKVYTRLNRKVPKNTEIILPNVVEAAGYKNLGWSVKKGDKTTYWKIGSKYKVTKNVTFYLVREKKQYVTASFRNSAGASNASYAKLDKTVEKGTYITLPTCGKLKGYENIGWTTVKGKSTPLYQAGTKYKMSKNTIFYIVRKPIYTVSFADTDGGSGGEFLALSRTATSGSSIVLPNVPMKEGYVGVGWSVARNDGTRAFKENSSYKVTKNITFYAVYKSSFSVKFMNNDGSALIGSVSAEQGANVKLIGYWEDGYTMMGWSTQPGQSISAQYEVGETLPLKSNLILYAVLFSKASEINYDVNTLPQIDTRSYTKVILVGDSRTALMQENMNAEFPAYILNGLTFIGKRGSGLKWLKTAGIQKLLEEIGDGGTIQKPIAVIFNSGVNDLENIYSYIAFMNDITPMLKEKRCKLFYMSVNPVNNVVLNNRGIHMPEELVRSFNSEIKSCLCAEGDAYTYIDTYSELYRTGFGHDNGNNVDDGLHFTKQTYKHIYAYMVEILNKR